MSDTISRDAAIRAMVQAHEETGVKTAQAIRIIRELPTADAVEVVRCKDCKHWVQIIAHGLRGTCDQWATINVTMEHNYCSRGERKETEK